MPFSRLSMLPHSFVWLEPMELWADVTSAQKLWRDLGTSLCHENGESPNEDAWSAWVLGWEDRWGWHTVHMQPRTESQCHRAADPQLIHGWYVTWMTNNLGCCKPLRFWSSLSLSITVVKWASIECANTLSIYRIYCGGMWLIPHLLPSLDSVSSVVPCFCNLCGHYFLCLECCWPPIKLYSRTSVRHHLLCDSPSPFSGTCSYAKEHLSSHDDVCSAV